MRALAMSSLKRASNLNALPRFTKDKSPGQQIRAEQQKRNKGSQFFNDRAQHGIAPCYGISPQRGLRDFPIG